MIAELHCHTSERSNCSHVAAVHLVSRAVDMGLQAIILTDHHYLWSEEELEKLRKDAGVDGIVRLFSGQEVTTRDYGDVLVYGADKHIKKKTRLYDIREAYPQAAIIWAHPYRKGAIPPAERLLDPVLDAVEIFSSNYSVAEAAKALQDWHELKFTAIGGTDTHALSYTGSYPTIFDHPFSTLEQMMQEIKAGRCRPYFKEIPRTGTTRTNIIELTVGPKSSETRQKMIIKKYENLESWKSAERTHRVIEEIYRKGFKDNGIFRVPKPLGKDKRNLALIEERVGDETLYDALKKSDKETSHRLLEKTGQWLAKLHNLRLKATPEKEFLQIEPERLQYYLKDMIEQSHPFLHRVQQVHDVVLQNEMELVKQNSKLLIQSHGDFHLKNIYVGKYPGMEEHYISAIDFGSSYRLPPSFDVGTFLAQYLNMFFNHPKVYLKVPVEIFLNAYVQRAKHQEKDFMAHVNVFKARACLSILYYLVKVGLGDSENFWRILIEAEKSIASIEFTLT